MSLSQFSVRQPVLMNLLTLFLVIAGYLAVTRMPREVFPEIPQGTINITAVYPGVSPAEMESLVGIKIEREIKDITGIDEINVASSEGVINITVTTDEGMPEDEVSRVGLDIQSAIGRIADLPADMVKPVVKVAKMEIPVVWLGLQSELPEMTTRKIAKDIQDELERLPGVSSAEPWGVRNLELRVEVSPEKLHAYNLSISRVMDVITARQSDIPGGTVKLDRGEYLIRVLGKASDAKAIREVVLKTTPLGTVRVKDVARVEEVLEDAQTLGRVGGFRSIYIPVNRKNDVDSIRLSDKIKKYMNTWNANAPDGISLAILFDTSTFIKRRQNTMYSNGITGFVLVLILLFVFLSFKAAVLTAIGIPVAFMGTFVIMQMMGITMNMMSMFGLIIALGMIVDDAIVVVENIYRYLMQGMTPKEAAIKGTDEVFWSVIGAVSTTVVAFSTLAFLPGNMGKILSVVPIVVALALSMSLLEALFVLPSHCAEVLRTPKHLKGEGNGEGITGEARWFIAMREGFAWFLRKVTRYWYVSLFLFVVGFIATLVISGRGLEFNPFPAKTIRRASINFEAAVGTKIEHTEKVVKELEEEIKKATTDEVESFWCMIGTTFRGHTANIGSHTAQCQINFAHDGNTSPRKPELMLNLWRQKLLNIPDVELFNVTVARDGPPAGSPIELQVRGPDQEGIALLSRQIREFAEKIPGVTDVTDDLISGKRELIVKVNPEQAAMYGLNPALVGLMIRRSFAGGIASKIQRDEDDINVVVKFPESRRQSINEILNMEITSPLTGKPIPFSAVATLDKGVGPGRLQRVNFKRTVTVSGDIDQRKTTSVKVNAELHKFTNKLARENPNYEFVYEGESKTSDELMDFVKMAALLSLLGIYIILATIFQSFLQPLIVLMAVPFGAVGVIVGLKFHSLPISMTALLGVVALLGIVVNDAIVLVDFINNARKEGMPLRDAVVQGGKLRLRPVILTTVTTIAGLLPMGLGVFGSEEFLQPMALSIVWGLAFSTILTLLLVPCIYMLIDAIRSVFWRIVRLVIPKNEVSS